MEQAGVGGGERRRERVRGEDRGGMGADGHSKNLDFDSE